MFGIVLSLFWKLATATIERNFSNWVFKQKSFDLYLTDGVQVQNLNGSCVQWASKWIQRFVARCLSVVNVLNVWMQQCCVFTVHLHNSDVAWSNKSRGIIHSLGLFLQTYWTNIVLFCSHLFVNIVILYIFVYSCSF